MQEIKIDILESSISDLGTCRALVQTHICIVNNNKIDQSHILLNLDVKNKIKSPPNEN